MFFLLVFVVFIIEVLVELNIELVIVMVVSWFWILWEFWVLSIVLYKVYFMECNGFVFWVEVLDEIGFWDNEIWGCNVSDIGEFELILMVDVFWWVVFEDLRSLVKL